MAFLCRPPREGFSGRLITVTTAPSPWAEPAAGRERGPQPLVPVLPLSGAVPAEMDATFRALGRLAAAGDFAARDALYAAFAPRLDHWVRRAQGSCMRHGFDPAIDPEDIAQEAFLVFADLVNTWDGRGSMSGYVIAYFPWRLSNAIRRMSDPRQHRSLDARPTALLTDGTVSGDEAGALLTAIAAELPDREGRILLLRIRDGLTWDQIAERIEVDRRTALRDWKTIVLRLRFAFRQAR